MFNPNPNITLHFMPLGKEIPNERDVMPSISETNNFVWYFTPQAWTKGRSFPFPIDIGNAFPIPCDYRLIIFKVHSFLSQLNQV